jgi:hypothetical protein
LTGIALLAVGEEFADVDGVAAGVDEDETADAVAWIPTAGEAVGDAVAEAELVFA